MRVLAALVGALLLAPAWADSAPGSSATEQALRAVANRDFARAEAILKTAATDKTFEALSEVERHNIHLALARSAFDAHDLLTARDAIRKACASPQSGGADWVVRVIISAAGDNEDLADSLVMLAEKYPASLADLWDTFVLQEMHDLIMLPDRRSGMRVLKAMFAAHWKPAKLDPDGMDQFWVRLALFEIEQNDLAGARAVATAIHDPVTLIQIVSDKRFDPVVAADPGHFNIATAAAAALQRARARMEANPELLEPIYIVASALMRFDRNEEALTLVDAALAKARNSEAAYTDQALAQPWITEQRGDLLARLGRHDDEIAGREQAAALPEYGTPNVSQTLNLAGKLNRLGRPREALAILEKVSTTHISVWGRMVYESNRACAYARLKDQPNFASSMAYVNAHAADAPPVPMATLLCARDEDGLAKEMIRSLDDPDTRLDMLLIVQDFPDPKQNAHADPSDAFLTKVRDRSDVQAAINKVGRMQHFPIRPIR